MTEFFPFFLILVAAVFFSEVFRRVHLPWVVALILAGVVLGPHGMEMVALNDTIRFLGQVGLVFLMFMAGLETHVPLQNGARARVVTVALLNSIVPFAVGFGVTWWFGFSLTTSLLVATAFVSSSIAIVIPTLESLSVLSTRVGNVILSATVMQDILSLVLLSIIMHTVQPVTQLPLPIFYLLLFLLLLGIRWLVPRIEQLFARSYANEQDKFQQELRVVLMMLVGIVLVFEVAGLHPIIAGFFAGLILSDSIRSYQFKEKLRAISYGVFIPLFFVVIGIRTDLTAFVKSSEALMMTGAIVGGSILAKLVSGWLGARIIGEHRRSASLIGAATVPQLSTTLAVVSSGLELNLLSGNLATSLIVLSIVTTLVSPLLVRMAAPASSSVY